MITLCQIRELSKKLNLGLKEKMDLIYLTTSTCIFEHTTTTLVVFQLDKDTGTYRILKLAAAINNFQNKFAILPGFYSSSHNYSSIDAPQLSFSYLLSHLSSLLEDLDYLAIIKKQLDIGKDFV